MGYLGFFIFFFSMLQASEPSMEWDDEMYKKSLAGPLQIGTATSWHTISKDVPIKTLSSEELKQAKGMARHLMASIQETMKNTHIKWRPYKSQVLVKAIACVNQSEWFAVRDMIMEKFKAASFFRAPKEVSVELCFIAKQFFVLGNTPKDYRGQVYKQIESLAQCLTKRTAANVFDEDIIPLSIMGVKFKRDDFPNSGSFQRYLENRTPYRFDPGHFWITLQCAELLVERFPTSSVRRLFKKLCELEQPQFLIKLVQTPVPLELEGDIDQYLQMPKDAPLDPQGPSGYWLKNVLLKKLEYFQAPSDWGFEFETREHTFRINVWWDSMSD